MRKGNTLKKEKRTEAIMGLLFIGLPLIGFFVFQLYPILWTFKWSFFSYNGIPSETKFIGLSNFSAAFADTKYWTSWITTLQFVFLKIPFEFALALFLAVIVSKVPGGGFFRSAYYLPAIVSAVVTGLIFTSMFTYDGFINDLLLKLNWIKQPVEWFSNKWSAMSVLILTGIWKGWGINLLYFVAAITGVPQDIYESADLDGAGPFVKFFKITLPMIAPVFGIVLLLSLVANLSVNETIITLTNGAPNGQTQSVMSYLTTKFVPGFTESVNPPLGYGCTLSFITTILFGLVAFGYDKFNKKLNNLQ